MASMPVCGWSAAVVGAVFFAGLLELGKPGVFGAVVGWVGKEAISTLALAAGPLVETAGKLPISLKPNQEVSSIRSFLLSSGSLPS